MLKQGKTLCSRALLLLVLLTALVFVSTREIQTGQGAPAGPSFPDAGRRTAALAETIYLPLLLRDYVPSAPHRFTVDGAVVKRDGVLFDPHGLWNPWSKTDSLITNQKILESAALQGFNTILVMVSPTLYPESTLSILEMAEAIGLSVIVDLQEELLPRSKTGTPQGSIDRAIAAVKNLRAYSSLMGYLLSDEPDYLLDTTADYLRSANLRVKQADPYHLTFVNLAKCSKAYLYRDSADVLMHEHHIYLTKDYAAAPPATIDAQYALQIQGLKADIQCFKSGLGNKPGWGVSFAFGNHYPPWGSYFTPRPATPTEYESIFYQWLINGATGIIGYTYRMDNSRWILSVNSPALWQKMSTLNAQQVFLYPVLTAGTPVGVTVSGAGADKIQAIARSFQGKLYLLTVNASPLTLVAGFTMAASQVGPAQVLWKNEYKSIRSNQSLSDTFSPYEARVYAINLQVDLSPFDGP
jgi:hypothetical protein